MEAKTERTVFDLANAVCEQTATENEIQELNDLMRSDSEARQIYLKVMDMHFDLDRMSLTGALSVKNDRCEPLLGKLDKLDEPKKIRSFSAFYAAAALIAVSLSILFLSKSFTVNRYEAIIIECQSPDWSVGDTLKIDEKIDLPENQNMKLKFGDETIVEISGPISTSLIQSDQNGRKFALGTKGDGSKTLILDSGLTQVEIKQAGKNSKTRFKVVETGNAFGIQFKEELTEVHVFEGLVTSQAASASKAYAEVQRIHNLQAASFNKDGLLKQWTQPDYKSFEVKRTITGVQSTNKNVHWLSTKPTSLEEGTLESNESIFLIQEKKNVVLPHEIPVTFMERLRNGKGGTQSGYKGHIRMLPGGTKVDSYLLHFDPATKKSLDGMIYFDRPIIAIIARDKQLDYSDKFFALDNVIYPLKDKKDRGLDTSKSDEGIDVLKFTGNSHSIGIRFSVDEDSIDHLRILVESE